MYPRKWLQYSFEMTNDPLFQLININVFKAFCAVAIATMPAKLAIVYVLTSVTVDTVL